MSRVLVVDDDGHIRDVMRFTLQQGGFQVVEAKDGAEASPSSRRVALT